MSSTPFWLLLVFKGETVVVLCNSSERLKQQQFPIIIIIIIIITNFKLRKLHPNAISHAIICCGSFNRCHSIQQHPTASSIEHLCTGYHCRFSNNIYSKTFYCILLAFIKSSFGFFSLFLPLFIEHSIFLLFSITLLINIFNIKDIF